MFKSRYLLSSVIVACSFLLLVKTSSASQFYVFAIKEIEGVSNSIPPEKRPLIDKRVRALLTGDLQLKLNQSFADKIYAAYPNSTVHPKQVRNTLAGGAYKYINNDNQVCGEGFVAPIEQSYAVVIGITRASWYQVTKERGSVELLIPITLNLQVVKPDKAKVVYSISDTLYTPFRFGSASELESNKSGMISESIVKGLDNQINALVKKLQQGFQPKETVVKIAASTSGVLVAEKGFEVGFVDLHELMAVNQKTKKQAIFKVLSAESGYSILKLIDGDASVGDEFIFQFESAADDSRKPRVMPVAASNKLQTSAIADLFSKDIGLSADFQIAAVDANFKDTQISIEGKAPCVAWDKFQAMRKDFEIRQDNPDYLLRFDYAVSPIIFESGQGGLETRESFISTVSAQLVDTKGNVLFSEFGQDSYQLDKKGGRGLDIKNATEISLKNATAVVAKKFITNVKFQPGEFEINSIGKNTFTVQGLTVPDSVELVYEVYRPLSVQVNGKKVVWRLALGDGQQGPKTEGDSTVISYSPMDVQVQRGDRLLVANMPKKGQTRLTECSTHYVAPGSTQADYLLPLIKHASYSSQKVQVAVTNPSFYQDSNALLSEGKFKLKMSPPAATDVCVKVGYSVKPEPPACNGSECSFDMLTATTIIHEKGDQRAANYVQAEKITVKGAANTQVSNFTGFKSVESASKNLSKLIEKLNTGK